MKIKTLFTTFILSFLLLPGCNEYSAAEQVKAVKAIDTERLNVQRTQQVKDLAHTNYNFGMQAENRGHLSMALTMYECANRFDPTNSEYRDALERIKRIQGNGP